VEHLRPDVGESVVPQLERAQVSEWREDTCRQVSDLIMRQVELGHGDETAERRRRDVPYRVASQQHRLHLDRRQAVRWKRHDEVLRHVQLPRGLTRLSA